LSLAHLFCTFVKDKFNCEDIALNFVASILTCECPLLFVRGRDPYVTYNPMDGYFLRS
jgi:glucuronyl/N-acetylglucosaminyl transferase EXT2/alpha-1,4-N-acetylglucosaminyltransferase EXTL3